mgnify:CR=1 FL=1
MITELYTIFDNVADEAGPIFQAKNFNVALRYVKELMKDSPIDPKEYSLVRLGNFNTVSMALGVAPRPYDAVKLSDVPTYVDDADEFMKANLTEEVTE